jgi:hypothetical protein
MTKFKTLPVIITNQNDSDEFNLVVGCSELHISSLNANVHNLARCCCLMAEHRLNVAVKKF